MTVCPWCRHKPDRRPLDSSFPDRCGRCHRGRKLDWRYCAWCFGAGFEKVSERRYTDRRYEFSCTACRGSLMRFMRYCPWCRRKITRAWKLEAWRKCPRCHWSVASDYWEHCPWCTRSLPRKPGK
jgi:hypothetical protein